MRGHLACSSKLHERPYTCSKGCSVQQPLRSRRCEEPWLEVSFRGGLQEPPVLIDLFMGLFRGSGPSRKKRKDIGLGPPQNIGKISRKIGELLKNRGFVSIFRPTFPPIFWGDPKTTFTIFFMFRSGGPYSTKAGCP